MTTFPKIHRSHDFFKPEYHLLGCVRLDSFGNLSVTFDTTITDFFFPVNRQFHIATDTRKIVEEQADVLILLQGENADAHDFLESSLLQQINDISKPLLIIGHKPIKELIKENSLFQLTEVYYLQVKNTLEFLQKWSRVHAQIWRQQFFKEEARLIAVVGSNGKTTTKEMIYSVIHQSVIRQNNQNQESEKTDYDVLKTQGNYNNHIGVPLTLLRLQSKHQYAVIEVGMNHIGEIALLGALVQPDVTLLTNTQREHQEFMLNLENVAKENGSMFAFTKKLVVYPNDSQHQDFQRIWQELTDHVNVKTYGITTISNNTGTSNTNTIKHITGFCSKEELINYPLILNITNGLGNLGTIKFELQGFGEHTAHNATGVIAAVLSLTNIAIEDIQIGLSQFLPPKGRLQPHTLNNRLKTLVIDDTYNANPDSVKAAIDVLSYLPSPKVLVLGDMGEVGIQGIDFHEEIGRYAFEHHIDVFLTFGELAHHAHHAFIACYHEQDNTQHEIKRMIADHFYVDEKHQEKLKSTVSRLTESSKTLLIKGSRFMKMERFLPSVN